MGGFRNVPRASELSPLLLLSYKEPSSEHDPSFSSCLPLSALSQTLLLFKAALDLLFNLI